ncbi:MAG: hypothetical protein H8E57_11360 [Candidatus Cloacimonetes bacterium]|nr:hypothetical protein [Candidatus Cloacimonadota bacterium]
MKRTSVVAVILAVLAFFVVAQKAYSFDIVGGYAYKETLIITGTTPWGFWQFEVLTLPAEGAQIKLDMETPRGWIEVADDEVGPDGDFLISHPLIEDGVFRVRVGTNPPSYVFHWNHSMPTEWMEYYYWHW